MKNFRAARLPSRENAEFFLPPPEIRRKKSAAENAAEFVKFRWLSQKFRLAGCDWH